ncbi:hypothetical protein QBC34DRAFT_417602 [Podospora aff. communis PSN243]|uniref:Ankyrin n=1 Tax=Podospora aff. communis PSN243 TaxID=3040156 RepID=A0AAV9G4R5_9PEZI|nr:hypothetical protein QBC34DRAFT_417602 [Podospora aff. communis PSN243]
MDTALSPIEQLVQELLDVILNLVPLDDTARLARCSKCLHFRLQPVLLENEQRRARAMKWACEKGLNNMIRTLVSCYGASPSLVVLRDRDRYGVPTGTWTLHLAAKHHRVDTFDLLLDLGATLEHHAFRSSTAQAFVTNLCQPENRDTLLYSFLHAGLATQLEQQHRDQMLMTVLISGIGLEKWEDERWPYLEVVRLLLDGGANPNFVQRVNPKTKKESLSPLSAAIMSHRWDLFDLLLARGANIHGAPKEEDHGHWVPHPLHVPMCAAAVAMARGQGRISAEPVQRCLDAGADINAAVLSQPFEDPDSWPAISWIRPVHLYLESIDSWEDERGVAEGLQDLLRKGASLDTAMEAPAGYYEVVQQSSYGIVRVGTYMYRLKALSPPVTTLLDKWPPDTLRQRSFLETIKILVRHGGLDPRPGKRLAKYDCSDDVGKEVVIAWQDLLAAVLNLVRTKEDRTGFLFDYIVAKGEYPKLGICDPSAAPWAPPIKRPVIGPLAYATVTRFILAGANINAVLSDARPQDPADKPQTALFKLCDRYACKSYHFFAYHLPRLVPERAAFLTWLVREAGADPTIKCIYWGETGCELRTAAELLRAEMGQFRVEERELAEELIKVLEK